MILQCDKQAKRSQGFLLFAESTHQGVKHGFQMLHEPVLVGFAVIKIQSQFGGRLGWRVSIQTTCFFLGLAVQEPRLATKASTDAVGRQVQKRAQRINAEFLKAIPELRGDGEAVDGCGSKVEAFLFGAGKNLRTPTAMTGRVEGKALKAQNNF